MEVRFSDDEIAEALTVLVNRMADEAGLSDKDRAMLKRWRSSKMKLGGDDMEDLVRKAKKAAAIPGTRYLHILSVCPTGWKHDPAQAIEVGRLATNSNVWPLYEVEDGVLRFTREPGKPTPVKDYLKVQGRFSSMDEAEIAAAQKAVEEQWARLKARAAPKVGNP